MNDSIVTENHPVLVGNLSLTHLWINNDDISWDGSGQIYNIAKRITWPSCYFPNTNSVHCWFNTLPLSHTLLIPVIAYDHCIGINVYKLSGASVYCCVWGLLWKSVSKHTISNPTHWEGATEMISSSSRIIPVTDKEGIFKLDACNIEHVGIHWQVHVYA